MAVSKTGRLLGILLLLRAKEWVSARELKERFQVSLRTVYRDIEAIQSHGIPIRGVPGPDGGYRLETDSVLDPFIITQDEALTLFLLSSMGANLPNDLQSRTDRVLEDIGNVIRPDDVKLLQLAKTRIFFDTADWYWRDEGTGLLPQLREAVFQQRSIEIAYRQRGESEAVSLRIAPYGLAWKGGQWYVVGRDLAQNKVGRYRVSRIVRLQTSETHFEYPVQFSLKDWWAREIAQFGKGEIEVRLIVHQEAREEFLTLTTKDTSNIVLEGDLMILTLYVDRWEWLIPLILSYGPSVRVERPPELQQAVVKSLEESLSKYREQALDPTRTFENDDSRRRSTRGRKIND